MVRLSYIFLFLMLSLSASANSPAILSQPCDLMVTTPQGQHFCAEERVSFCGTITTSYPEVEYEWFENGRSANFDLCDDTAVDENTIFTLMVTATNDVNLIANGDFANGDDGSFSSDYTPGQGNCFHSAGFLGCEGFYNVLSDPGVSHTDFASCDDISGEGNMMVVNGAEFLQEIWCQDVCVDPEASYLFSAWATSVNPSSPAQLQFSIDGDLIGNIFGLNGTNCSWEQFEEEWQADGQTTVTICVTNQNTSAGGNDFALDEIEFYQVCHEEASFEVTVSDLEIDIDEPDELDCEDNTTNIELDISSQYNVDDIIWRTDEGNIIEELFGGLEIIVDAGGTYFVSIFDEFGCEFNDEIFVESEIVIPDVDIMALDTLDCQTTSIELLAMTNAGDEEFEWEDQNGNFLGDDATIIISATGRYTVTVTDDNNECSNTASIEITANITPTSLSLLSSNNLDCNNSSTIVSTMNPFQTISWSTTLSGTLPTTNDSLIVTQPGTYFAFLDQGSCSTLDSIVVTETIPNFSYLPSSNLDVLTCTNPTATAMIELDTALFAVQWLDNASSFGNSTTVTIDNPGLYAFNIVDSLGCVMKDSILIGEDRLAPAIEANATLIECNQPTSFLSLSVTNNVTISPVSWTLPDGTLLMDDTEIEITEPGTVIYTVTNSVTGCSLTDSIVIISVMDIPEVSLFGDTLSCSNPLGTLTAISPDNIVSYVWTLPDGTEQQGANITSNQVGAHRLTAIDEKGCVFSELVQLVENSEAPVLSPIADITLTCLTIDTTLAVTIGPEEVLEWRTPTGNQAGTELTISEPGTYQLVATNEIGCSTTIGFQVLENTEPPNIEITTETLDCQRPVVTTEVTTLSGPPLSNIQWSFPDGTTADATTIDISEPGSYMALATGTNGCQEEFDFIVEEELINVAFSLEATPVDCNTTESTISFLSTSQDITQVEFFVGNLSIGTGNTVVVDGDQEVSVVVTDRCGDDQTDTIRPEQDSSKVAFSIIADPLGCQVSGITLEISSDDLLASVSIIDENGNLVGDETSLITIPGLYTVNATGLNGCVTTEEIEVIEDAATVAFTASPITLDCNNRTAAVEIITAEVYERLSLTNAAGDLIAEVNFGTELEVTDAGSYTLTVTNTNGCTSSVPLEVQLDDTKVLFDLAATVIDCSNTSSTVEIITNDNYTSVTVLDLAGNEVFAADNVLSTVTLVEPGDFTFAIENTNGCISTELVTVEIDTATIDFTLTGGALECNVPTVVIDIVTTDDFVLGSYSSPTQEDIPLTGDLVAEESGRYSVELIANNGCPSEQTIEILQNTNVPELLLFSSETLDCNGNGQITDLNIAGGLKPYTINLDNQLVTETSIIPVAGTGTHSLTISDANGCTLDTTFVLEPLEGFSIQSIPEFNITQGSDLQLSVEADIPLEDLSFSWLPLRDLSCYDCPSPIFSGIESTDYTVTATNAFGCEASAQISIIVESEIKIYIPNVIDISSNSTDNRFTIFTGADDIESIQELRIYDRWGNLIFVNENFQPNDPSLGWDGRYNNQQVDPGVFVYMAVLKYPDGTTELFAGDVTVIK